VCVCSVCVCVCVCVREARPGHERHALAKCIPDFWNTHRIGGTYSNETHVGNLLGSWHQSFFLAAHVDNSDNVMRGCPRSRMVWRPLVPLLGCQMHYPVTAFFNPRHGPQASRPLAARDEASLAYHFCVILSHRYVGVSRVPPCSLR
jgi:hypothetical protein